MRISYQWLRRYFHNEIPDAHELADLLTRFSYEVETVEGGGETAVLDIDVLPNRAHDSLSHRGVAKEISALTGIPLHKSYVTDAPRLEPSVSPVAVHVEDPKRCRRYMACRVEGVKAGASPAWLSASLEQVGQQSVNSVVDITNYVMFDIGQPMHAFDAEKIRGDIVIRQSRAGETITTLDGVEIVLPEGVTLIADDVGPLAIAGVKGGERARVDENTRAIVLEAANFSPGHTRYAVKRCGIATDSSKRFENELHPKLAEYGMYQALRMLEEVAREQNADEPRIGMITDIYATPIPESYQLGISAEEIYQIVGFEISEEETRRVLERLGFSYEYIDTPREYVVRQAREAVNASYRLGASVSADAPHAFDCSSLAAYVHVRAGISIPRISVDQYVYGKSVSEEEMLPGDVVFANSGTGKIHTRTVEWMAGTEVPEGVDHVGIYVGDGKVVHASRSAGKVIEETLADSDAFSHIVGVRRFVSDAPRFAVIVPFERLDMRLREDLVEEIVRIFGYDKIPALKLPHAAPPAVTPEFYLAQEVRTALVKRGYWEVITYAFDKKGDVELANPPAKDKRFLRRTLSRRVKDVLDHGVRYADLLGLDLVQVFEVGTVFAREGEYTALAVAFRAARSYRGVDAKRIRSDARSVMEELVRDLSDELGVALAGAIMATDQGAIFEVNLSKYVDEVSVPASYGEALTIPDGKIRYRPFSPYPFVVRDIAVFVPSEVPQEELRSVIVRHAGDLLAREPRLFDVYRGRDDRADRVSYAYRLVFQAPDRTLTDEEVNGIMRTIERAISERGWKVR